MSAQGLLCSHFLVSSDGEYRLDLDKDFCFRGEEFINMIVQFSFSVKIEGSESQEQPMCHKHHQHVAGHPCKNPVLRMGMHTETESLGITMHGCNLECVLTESVIVLHT